MTMAPHVRARITKVERESDNVSTLAFDAQISGEPGQFLMAWLPGFDEKPFSIGGLGPLRISVGACGPFSKRLVSMKKGDFLWLRGPYGRGFEFNGKRMLLVGGGYGFAPLRFLADEAKKRKFSATAICGARNEGLLMKPASCRTVYATDDGSEGVKGNVLAAMEQEMACGKFDTVYTCGPERMMGAVARLARKNGADCQLLVERYMKCGIGVCGHCCMGESLVCWDGPRFGYEVLENPEFEKTCRDRAGRKVRL